MSVGGSIESITIDGRLFPVASDADSNRKLGGKQNEVQENGNGSARLIKTNTAWMMDGLALDVDDLSDDLEYLQSKANTNGFFPCVVKYASGAIYSGNGQITGDLQMSSQNATAPITLSGTGVLTRQ
jgi:hypothetical protein